MIDHKWFDTAASTDRDRVKYGYDQNSNRTWRQNTLATGHDAFYTYDVFNRLTDIQRGTLAGTAPNYTGVTGPTFAQQWTLDALGNWSTFKQDSNGGAPGSWDLAQNRSHNKANETTVVSGYIGLDWVDPVHDAAGNMTTLPKPNDPTKGYTAVYDAWNRLVEVRDGTSGATVAKYEYDGLGRRIVKQEYDTPGTYSRDRHYYYTIGWQVIEERIGSNTAADRQFVWGLMYVDNLILRDRDANSGGGGNLGVPNSGLDERLYSLQDANFNVTAITDTAGNPVERYRYTPYGERTVLDASFVVKSAGSGVEWEVGHQGLFHDDETGLIYNRVRMLHPGLGRFLQRDPLGYIDGMNLYQLVASNPTNNTDYLGLFSFFGPCTSWSAVPGTKRWKKTGEFFTLRVSVEIPGAILPPVFDLAQTAAGVLGLTPTTDINTNLKDMSFFNRSNVALNNASGRYLICRCEWTEVQEYEQFCCSIFSSTPKRKTKTVSTGKTVSTLGIVIFTPRFSPFGKRSCNCPSP